MYKGFTEAVNSFLKYLEGGKPGHAHGCSQDAETIVIPTPPEFMKAGRELMREKAQEGPVEKMPPWARDMAAILSLESTDGRSMWKVYQDGVRPLLFDKEKAQTYGSNYGEFYARNCQGCANHMPSCGYLKGSGDKKGKFMEILEGEAGECDRRILRAVEFYPLGMDLTEFEKSPEENVKGRVRAHKLKNAGRLSKRLGENDWLLYGANTGKIYMEGTRHSPEDHLTLHSTFRDGINKGAGEPVIKYAKPPAFNAD